MITWSQFSSRRMNILDCNLTMNSLDLDVYDMADEQ